MLYQVIYIFVIIFSQATNKPTTVKKHNNVPPATPGVSLPLIISLIFFFWLPTIGKFLEQHKCSWYFWPLIYHILTLFSHLCRCSSGYFLDQNCLLQIHTHLPCLVCVLRFRRNLSILYLLTLKLFGAEYNFEVSQYVSFHSTMFLHNRDNLHSFRILLLWSVTLRAAYKCTYNFTTYNYVSQDT